MSEDMDTAYTADLARILYRQALKKEFTDFSIRAGSKTVHCHQTVVSAKSEYFHSICASGLTEAILEHSKEEDEQILMSVVKFMYLGNANITPQNVESLVLAAAFIKHAELKQKCEEIMIANLTVPNLSRYHALAKKLGLSTLGDECTRIGREKFSQVSLSDWFLSLSIDEVEQYLQDDELNVPTENDVIDAVQRWLMYSRATSSGKEGYIDILFHCIRLPYCNQSKLEDISKDPNVLDKFRLRILEYLQHGLHGDRKARKSYPASCRSKPTGASGSPGSSGIPSSSGQPGTSGKPGTFGMPSSSGTLGSSAKSATPTSGVREKARLGVSRDTASSAGLSGPPQAATADTAGQEKLLILGGSKKDNIRHTNVIALGDENTDSPTIASLSLADFSLCTDGGSLIISGGQSMASLGLSVPHVKQFSLSTAEWADLSDMPAPVSRHGSAYVDRRLFTIGGARVENFALNTLSSAVNSFDFVSGTWSPCEDLPEALERPGVAVVEKDILAVGGWDGKCHTGNTYKFNTRTLKWTTCSPMSGIYGNCQFSTVTVDKKVFVLHNFEFSQYDVATDQWNKLLPHPKHVTKCALVPKQGQLMALGGYENSWRDPNDDIYTYDIPSNTWKLQKMRMPVALNSHWAVVLREHKC